MFEWESLNSLRFQYYTCGSPGWELYWIWLSTTYTCTTKLAIYGESEMYLDYPGCIVDEFKLHSSCILHAARGIKTYIDTS
jgi:hypothetical protein